MANKEHVALLKQGVEAWNQWRAAHPKARPDLCGADLSYANLRGADLLGATLGEADLSQANLGYANLRGTDLSERDLTPSGLAVVAQAARSDHPSSLYA